VLAEMARGHGLSSQTFRGCRAGLWQPGGAPASHVGRRHLGLSVTASLNLGIVEYIPEVRDAFVQRDLAIMSHGTLRARSIYGLSVEEERALYPCVEM
jgi:hypothetical protein